MDKKYVFKNAVLEIMYEHLEKHRDKLIQGIAYLPSVDMTATIESRGRLKEVNDILLATEELDAELSKKDDLR